MWHSTESEIFPRTNVQKHLIRTERATHLASMPEDDLLYLIALTQAPQIGPVHARLMLTEIGQAKDVFRSTKKTLESIPGIGTARASAIHGFREFQKAEAELRFIEKFRIEAISWKDERYPKRLAECYDAPVLLFYRGNADLNANRSISVIGTRTPSEYGKDMVRELIRVLAPYQPLVVSGLAYGIDTLAHKYALKQGLDTLGILAHGLDRIYPTANKSMARQMLEQGGLLTDFPSGTNPDAQNFPRRNRIVAGLSDAVIVVETGEKGGSIITANHANGYNREVFALPGRITDVKSSGCHELIRTNRAALLTDAVQVAESLRWEAYSEPAGADIFPLPSSLGDAEKQILDLLQNVQTADLEEIRIITNLDRSALAGTMLALEMGNHVAALPGNRYRKRHG